MNAAQTRLAIAIDVIAEIDRSTLTDEMRYLLDHAEAAPGLVEQDLSGKGRDPDLVEHATSLGLC
jgi:hypothetical protein